MEERKRKKKNEKEKRNNKRMMLNDTRLKHNHDVTRSHGLDYEESFDN